MYKKTKKSLRKIKKKHNITGSAKPPGETPEYGQGNQWLNIGNDSSGNIIWENNDYDIEKHKKNALTCNISTIDNTWFGINNLYYVINNEKDESERNRFTKILNKKILNKWNKVKPLPEYVTSTPDNFIPNKYKKSAERWGTPTIKYWGKPKVIEEKILEDGTKIPIYADWWYKRCDPRNPPPDKNGDCEKGKIPLNKFYKWARYPVTCCYSEEGYVWRETAANITRCMRTSRGFYHGYSSFGSTKPYVPGFEDKIVEFFEEDVNRPEGKKVTNSEMHHKFINEMQWWIDMHSRHISPDYQYRHYHNHNLTQEAIDRAQAVKNLLLRFGKEDRKQTKNDLYNALKQKNVPEDLNDTMTELLGPLYQAYEYEYKILEVKTFEEAKEDILKIFSDHKNEKLELILSIINEVKGNYRFKDKPGHVSLSDFFDIYVANNLKENITTLLSDKDFDTKEKDCDKGTLEYDYEDLPEFKPISTSPDILQKLMCNGNICGEEEHKEDKKHSSEEIKTQTMKRD
tara:strand:+ start:13075 stop:14619 length:1545 start_codon:yes stop_codon:yes gene_type:complete